MKKKKKEIDQTGSLILIHLPKLLVSEKCYLFNASEQLGILYCVMFSTVYRVHIWDKAIVSLFYVL